MRHAESRCVGTSSRRPPSAADSSWRNGENQP